MYKIYAFADEADQNFDGQIRAMKRNGLTGLEIRNSEYGNVSDLSETDAKLIKAKLDDAGLVVGSLGSPIGKIDIMNDDFTKHLDQYKHTLEIAKILGANRIRLFSFYIPKDRSADEFKNEVIDRMGKFAEIAEGSGILLCHENEKGIYGDIAPRCLDVLKAIPSIKAVFDPANFIQCGQETLSAWQMLSPYVEYLHIKDALSDGSVVPAGKGEGNLEKIISDYISNGGTDFTVEPHLTVFSGLSSLEREGEKSNVGKYVFDSSDSAFDAACDALNSILH